MYLLIFILDVIIGAYVVVQFYPWFKFYFPLFQTHLFQTRTLPYPKTYKLERMLRKYKVCEDAVRHSALANCTQLVSEMTDIVGRYMLRPFNLNCIFFTWNTVSQTFWPGLYLNVTYRLSCWACPNEETAVQQTLWPLHGSKLPSIHCKRSVMPRDRSCYHA